VEVRISHHIVISLKVLIVLLVSVLVVEIVDDTALWRDVVVGCHCGDDVFRLLTGRKTSPGSLASRLYTGGFWLRERPGQYLPGPPRVDPGYDRPKAPGEVSLFVCGQISVHSLTQVGETARFRGNVK
jgi:hypothetical protein